MTITIVLMSPVLFAACGQGSAIQNNQKNVDSKVTNANNGNGSPDNSNVTASAGPAVTSNQACALPKPQTKPSQKKASTVVIRVINAAARVKTFQAAMQVTSCNPQIGGAESVAGQIRSKRVGENLSLFIDYSGIAPKQISAYAQKVEVYQPKINQVLRLSGVAARRKYYGTYLNRYMSLIRYAKKVYLGDEQIDGVRTALLELTPRRRDKLESVYVWVDYQRWFPVQFILKDKSEITTIKFSARKFNERLADSEFKLKYPSGAKIVYQ